MSDTIKYFRHLYDPIYFPIQVVDEYGQIIYINKPFSEQWGYNISELKEYSVFRDAELKRNGIQAIIHDVFNTGEIKIQDNYTDSLLRSKEITIPFFRTGIFPISVGNKKYVVLFHEDQTDKILAEEEVKRARDGNKEAERLKNTFLNVLSHELRTPLNIILGYSSIIRENLKDKVSSEDKIYLENLYSGSERLFKSITQMLEFAQIEAGEYKLNIERVDLSKVLKDCLNLVRNFAIEKKLDIKTNFMKEPIFVDIDIHCVENAINNLLSNAVKFTKQGFIEVELNVLEDRELAVCKIRDSGIGISTQYMDHLFRPFSQEDLNIGRNYEGNGLGLALSKRYIEKMGGSLLVDSIKGVGSTFTFTLPLSQSGIKAEKSRDVKIDRGLPKILMLDDSGSSYELLNAFLKNAYDIKVYSLRDFKLQFIREHDFSAIVFDVNQTHWEQSILICKDLKNNDPLKRPVIILSSEFNEAKIQRFYDAGADKFLIKPFSKKELLGSLNETMKVSN